MSLIYINRTFSNILNNVINLKESNNIITKEYDYFHYNVSKKDENIIMYINMIPIMTKEIKENNIT